MLKINRSILCAALVSLCSWAVAQEASTLTRAEVKAELARAAASGELARLREQYGESTPVTSARMPFGAQGRALGAPGLSRAEVMAEAQRARASGEMARAMEVHGGGN